MASMRPQQFAEEDKFMPIPQMGLDSASMRPQQFAEEDFIYLLLDNPSS